MKRFLTVTADVKRSPPLSSGRRGEPEYHLRDIRCAPLDPVDSEIRERLGLDTPHEVLQTFTEDHPIQEGDILIVWGESYPIRSVGDWGWRKTKYLHLVIEELKK